MARKGLDYTSGEKTVIESAWHTLMRCVESSWLQESRLRTLLRVETKEFGSVSAKALVMDQVRRGLQTPGPVTLANLSRERDEKVMAYIVGVYLRSERDHLPEGPEMLFATLTQADAAWTTAHTRYLESVR